MNSSFYFIQIGANDGGIDQDNNSYDPINQLIRKYEWNGILVEPLKNVFANYLKPYYKDNNRIKLENVAISNKNEKRKLNKIAARKPFERQ